MSSLVAQIVKNPPAMQATWVWSLGWEDTLEEGTAAHSSILAWESPWTEVPGGQQFMRLQESDMTKQRLMNFNIDTKRLKILAKSKTYNLENCSI